MSCHVVLARYGSLGVAVVEPRLPLLTLPLGTSFGKTTIGNLTAALSRSSQNNGAANPMARALTSQASPAHA
jgi:hypothetical protein